MNDAIGAHMKFDIIVDDKTYRVEVPQEILDDGEEFFRKMDRDMDGGWRMGPEFIEHPDPLNRCQIAANKILVSLSTRNDLMIKLMAGYIVKRMPGAIGVRIDTDGEMLNTELMFEHAGNHDAAHASSRRKMTEAEAREQSEKDVTKVYKVGKAYRFAMYDTHNKQWQESALVATEAEARALRAETCEKRFAELMGA